MKEGYRQDLAYIHDVGHRNFALQSAPAILDILNRTINRSGFVIDLGCGPGLLAEMLIKEKYRVLGIDISRDMIRIARDRVPDAEFRVGSLLRAPIPRCDAVMSIGECINYLFDPANNRITLRKLFGRVYRALVPGGVFIFDVAEPGQVDRSNKRGFSSGKDWAVLFEKQEARNILTRRLTTFRKIGDGYRRDHEVHKQRLYKSVDVAYQLRSVGFRVRIMRAYGNFKLPPAHAAFVASKPMIGAANRA